MISYKVKSIIINYIYNKNYLIQTNNYEWKKTQISTIINYYVVDVKVKFSMHTKSINVAKYREKIK